MNIEIINLLIKTVGVALVMIISFFAKKYIEEYKLIKWVLRAVQAAEKLFDLPESGEEKKKYVLDFLKRKYPNLEGVELDILIEAAVQSLDQITLEQDKSYIY